MRVMVDRLLRNKEHNRVSSSQEHGAYDLFVNLLMLEDEKRCDITKIPSGDGCMVGKLDPYKRRGWISKFQPCRSTCSGFLCGILGGWG